MRSLQEIIDEFEETLCKANDLLEEIYYHKDKPCGGQKMYWVEKIGKLNNNFNAIEILGVNETNSGEVFDGK
jgi:hypothetical protein